MGLTTKRVKVQMGVDMTAAFKYLKGCCTREGQDLISLFQSAVLDLNIKTVNSD